MGDVNLSISQEVVMPIIEAKVSAALCEALSGSQNIVSNVVARVLSQKVDNEGKPSHYGSRDEVTYIQWLCGEAIRNAAKQAVKNYIDGANEKIVKEIEKAMSVKSHSIAVNLVNSFMSAVKENYRIKVDVSATIPDKNY